MNMTRNSKVEMISSILDNWSEIGSILNDKKQLHRINGVHQNQLLQIKNLLEYFKTTSGMLQKNNFPTIHDVIPHYYHLLDICEIDDIDSTEIQILKTNLVQMNRTKWYPEIKIQHKVALFLFSPCKYLQV